MNVDSSTISQPSANKASRIALATGEETSHTVAGMGCHFQHSNASSRLENKT